MGLLLDAGLILAGITISVTYLIELEAVCLIDIMTGDRARLVAEALQSEREYSEMMGLPIPRQQMILSVSILQKAFCL